MVPIAPDDGELMRRCIAGDGEARQQLLTRHRDRLRHLVLVHLDRRLLARLDPSDVVQEVLVEAHQKLDDYLRDQPVPFYPWLREIAWQRLLKIREHHQAHKRNVHREQGGVLELPEDSAMALAERFVGHGTSPSARVEREERQQHVLAALQELRDRDREILVLRFLEQLTTPEIAAILGISEGAVKTRQARALVRLQAQLGGEEFEP